MKIQKQTGNTTIVLAVILVALLAVAGLMLTKTAPPATTSVPAIQGANDLEKTTKELDAVNPDSMDTELNEVSKDATAI